MDQRFDVEMLRAAQGGVCHQSSIANVQPSYASCVCSSYTLTNRLSQLQLDPQYRSLARDRSQAAGRKTRVMRVIDDPRNLLLRPMPVGYMKRKVRLFALVSYRCCAASSMVRWTATIACSCNLCACAG